MPFWIKGMCGMLKLSNDTVMGKIVAFGARTGSMRDQSGVC